MTRLPPASAGAPLMASAGDADATVVAAALAPSPWVSVHR